MKALNHHVERVFNRDRKDIHWGERKLKGDRWDRTSKQRSSSICRATSIAFAFNTSIAWPRWPSFSNSMIRSLKPLNSFCSLLDFELNRETRGCFIDFFSGLCTHR
jgi:hypothetical protein